MSLHLVTRDRPPVSAERAGALRVYGYACEGMLLAVKRGCEPRPQEDPDNPLTQIIPYYGIPVDMAVWWAKYVMREARRLGLWC